MQRRGSSQGGRRSRGKHRASVGVQLGTWALPSAVEEPTGGQGETSQWTDRAAVWEEAGASGRLDWMRPLTEEPWQILKEGDNMMQMLSTI